MPETPSTEALWSHEKTAEYLDISPWTLHQWNSKGRGPRSYKLGRHRKYKPEDVAAWLEERASDRSGTAK